MAGRVDCRSPVCDAIAEVGAGVCRGGDTFRSEIDKEMQFHLAERADDLVAGGMKPDAAQREARRRFGSLAYQTEQTRARDLFSWLDALTADLRYATRSLKSAPAFAVVAILSDLRSTRKCSSTSPNGPMTSSPAA